MISSIIRHELRLIIFNRKAWYCLAVLYSLLAFIFNWLLQKYLHNQTMLDTANFGLTEEVIHPFYAWFALLILICLPMIATQAICAEKVNKTIINYNCAPISGMQIILAKFLAILIVLFMITLLISIVPLAILHGGRLDWGQLGSSIIGVQLMISAALAISLGIASCMKNIMRANFVILFVLLGFVLLEWAAQFAGQHTMFLQSFGLLAPLKNFLCGIINVQNIAYYFFLSLAFILMASWRITRGDKNV
jgi:ABC-2 type transport system permease protein